MAGPLATRVLAVTCLVLGIVVVAVVLLGGRPGAYEIRARFVDAGQLVRGNLVEVGGRRVGEVTDLQLTDDGRADVVLRIDDEDLTPLRDGTVAAIRTVGLASVTNRVVALEPGPPEGAVIADGGVLESTHTRGIVDLDMLLNAANPRVRRDLRAIVREAAGALADPVAGRLNGALAYLHPALSQTAALGREVVRDQAALETLVATGAQATGALASREEDLGAGLESAAAALRQVAGRREALGGLIDAAPETLRQADATLRRLATTLPVVDPVLRDSEAAVDPLERLLRAAVPVARDAQPAIAEIERLLPQAAAILAQIPPLDKRASPALDSATAALRDLLPVIAGLRPYGPDFVGGLFNGFGGAPGGSYDANGHYIRISMQGAPSSLPGLLPTPDFSFPSNGYRTGLVARCPGAAEEPAADRSNPWIPDPGLCDPAHNMDAAP